MNFDNFVAVVFALVAVAVIAFEPFTTDPPARAVEATTGEPVPLKRWQARVVVLSNARMQGRDDLHVARMVRHARRRIRVCWRDPDSYTGFPGTFDVGCDIVELRGREFWIFDDSQSGLGWRRFL